MRNVFLLGTKQASYGWNDHVLFSIHVPFRDDWHEGGVVLLGPLGQLGHQRDTPILHRVDHVGKRLFRHEVHDSIQPEVVQCAVTALTPARRAFNNRGVKGVKKLFESDLIIIDTDVIGNRILAIEEHNVLLVLL